MRITCKNQFPFIKIAVAKEIRLHLYLFIICYECLPVYGYPGMGNMESGQILEFIFVIFCQYKNVRFLAPNITTLQNNGGSLRKR